MPSVNMETVTDDLQLKIDNFFERKAAQDTRLAREFREDSLRSTMVDHPHADFKKVQKIFQKLLKESLESSNLEFYDSKWQSSLLGEDNRG